jgi:hypothetical protein
VAHFDVAGEAGIAALDLPHAEEPRARRHQWRGETPVRGVSQSTQQGLGSGKRYCNWYGVPVIPCNSVDQMPNEAPSTPSP